MTLQKCNVKKQRICKCGAGFLPTNLEHQERTLLCPLRQALIVKNKSQSSRIIKWEIWDTFAHCEVVMNTKYTSWWRFLMTDGSLNFVVCGLGDCLAKQRAKQQVANLSTGESIHLSLPSQITKYHSIDHKKHKTEQAHNCEKKESENPPCN